MQRKSRGSPLQVTPVSSPLLIEETARALRELIVEGKLQAGERLSERDLGAQLGVSRTPLREALFLLAAERLVDLSPRRAARVASLDAATVDDIFPVMKTLERLAVDLACTRMDAAGLARLQALQEAMAGTRKCRDKAAFLEQSQRFHDAILEAAGNTTLREMHAHLSGRVRRAIFLSLDSDAEWGEAVAGHATLLAALVSRNSSAAVKAVSRGVDARRRKVLKHLETS